MSLRIRQEIQAVPRQAELSPRRIQVTAGILIDRQVRLLITDRARATTYRDCWEFPGGKIREGESSRAALERELGEELGIRLLSVEPFTQVEHDYTEFSVAIDFFLVRDWQGEPGGREEQALRWILPHELREDLLLPADAPLLPKLRNLNRY